jgi:hypothetical protein
MAQTSDWLTNSKNDAKVFGRQQSIFRKLKHIEFQISNFIELSVEILDSVLYTSRKCFWGIHVLKGPPISRFRFY